MLRFDTNKGIGGSVMGEKVVDFLYKPVWGERELFPLLEKGGGKEEGVILSWSFLAGGARKATREKKEKGIIFGYHLGGNYLLRETKKESQMCIGEKKKLGALKKGQSVIWIEKKNVCVPEKGKGEPLAKEKKEGSSMGGGRQGKEGRMKLTTSTIPCSHDGNESKEFTQGRERGSERSHSNEGEYS